MTLTTNWRRGSPRMFSLSGRLMRVLGSIVQILRPAMLDRGQHLAVRHLVAGELVGDNHPRHVPQSLEWLAVELLGCLRVSAGLDQHVEHVAVLVDSTPHPPSLPRSTTWQCWQGSRCSGGSPATTLDDGTGTATISALPTTKTPTQPIPCRTPNNHKPRVQSPGSRPGY